MHAPAFSAAALAEVSSAPAWLGPLGQGDVVIASVYFVFLLAIWVLLVLLWLRMDRLVHYVKKLAEAATETPWRDDPVPAVQLPNSATHAWGEEQERRMKLMDEQLRETTAMVREVLPVLQKIKTTQAAALAAQSAPSPKADLERPSLQQPPRERVPFEENYNAVFGDPARDERVPGIKDQFRVNFRDKGSSDRNPDASSPLVRDSSGWLSIFVEEATGILYLAPSLAFRAGTLMNTHVSKLNSLFAFPGSPVTRLERAATVRRVGDEFHLDTMGSMS